MERENVRERGRGKAHERKIEVKGLFEWKREQKHIERNLC